jgi:hypothetical protein
MFTGLALMIPSVVLLVAAQQAASMAILLVASAIGGASGALGYRGSLQVINEIAPGDRRAETISTYLLACYTGVSLPVIGIGVLSTLAGAQIADMVFAGVLCVLAIAAAAVDWTWGGQGKPG